MLVCVPENQGGCASGLVKMTQWRLGITKCSRNWTLWCCSPKPTPNSTYRSHLHCSTWRVGLCVLSIWVHSCLAAFCRSWGHSLHAISAAHSPSLPSPRSQQQRPCLTVPNWAQKGNPNWSEMFRVLCKVFFSSRCSETVNTVRCRSPSFTVPKGALDYRDQKDLSYLN